MNATAELPSPHAVVPPAPTTVTAARTMRAIVHPRYGTPDVLQYQEVAVPSPGPGQVLVRVHAAGVSVGDHHIVTGQPYLIRLSPFGGVPRPRQRVPGMAMAGRVEAVGANVTTLQPGDEVCGEAPGAFAEYAVVPANLLAPKPTNLTFEEAAATPWAVTALQGLRDAGRLQPGQRALIIGASGGVGTWAVQIAKALGATVTAVCSARNVEMVRALGADEVIDYTSADFTAGGARFDLVLDLVGNRSVADCRKVIVPGGTFVSCAGGGSALRWLFRIGTVLVTSLFTSQKLTTLVVRPNREDLLVLKQLVEEGKARPIIERRYPLREAAAALWHVGQRHARGQTVVSIADPEIPQR